MSSHQHLAAPESNERKGKDDLTDDQKGDLFLYISPLTRLQDMLEGSISTDLYDEQITLHTEAYDSYSVFMKNGYPIGWSDNVCALYYIRPELGPKN